MKRGTRRLLLFAVASTVAFSTWCIGQRGAEAARAREASLERRIAEAAGLNPADPDVDADQAFAEIASRFDTLDEQLTQLRGIVPRVEVREVEVAVTNPINVELRRLLERRERELEAQRRAYRKQIADAVAAVARERPECTGLIRPADCPVWEPPPFEFDFSAVIARATFESDAGNHYGVLEAELYEGPCQFTDDGQVVDGSCTFLGSATDRKDVGELVAGLAPSRPKRLGWYAGVQYAVSTSSISASAYADCDYPGNANPPPFSCEPGSSSVSAELARFRVYGGPEVRWKRLALRLGAFVDSDAQGVDLGMSWRGTR